MTSSWRCYDAECEFAETTLQAEDRCHRPGETREVHVHYLLSSHTVDEQMYDLVDQKWAAQRAVQDREA